MKNIGWKKLLSAIFLVGMEPLAELVDTTLLASCSPLWVASLAATNVFFSSFCWVLNFLLYGFGTRVAHARDSGRLGAQIFAGLILAGLCGLGLTPILLLGRDFFLREVLSVPDSILETTRTYWTIRVSGFPLTVFAIAISGILRGLGHFNLALIMVGTITMSHVLVSSIGLFILNYGIGAAAAGAVIGFAAGVIPAFIWIVWRYLLPRFSWPTREELLSIGSDSLHIFGRSGALTLCFFVMTALISRLGAIPLAAHQISLQIWIFSAYIIDGLAMIAMSDGGYALGQKKYGEFFSLGRQLQIRGIALGFLFLLVLAFLRGQVMEHFATSQGMEDALLSLWWIVILTQPLNAYVYVTDGLLLAARKFSGLRQVMWLGLFAFLPLAAMSYFLANLVGIWLSLVIFNGCRAIGNYLLMGRLRNELS